MKKSQLFENVLYESLLEEIRSASHSVMVKFEEIADQIHPTFENLDSWSEMKHSKLDESQKLSDDFDDLRRRLTSLQNATNSFSRAQKPIQNINGANTLINSIAGYVTSVNNAVKNDGLEVKDGEVI